jgi:hypothetical protein
LEAQHITALGGDKSDSIIALMFVYCLTTVHAAATISVPYSIAVLGPVDHTNFSAKEDYTELLFVAP